MFLFYSGAIVVMPEPRVAVIIPAYNEADNIGRAIDLVRKTGVAAEIVVADDGSTDSTAEIARKAGCTVISMPKNIGKTNAFFAGLRAALKTRPDAVIALDADITALPKNSLQALASAAVSASKAKKAAMIIARITEGIRLTSACNSGTRAFSSPAAWRLSSCRLKSLPKGLGLEAFLNEFFGNKTEIIQLPGITAKGPYRHGFREQSFEVASTYERLKKARRILERRRPK